ncbi:MAG: response regulator transcription factor [Clostridiales bacterium]|mgnify:CR=1 FL=1|jgi:DNA-binding response OmpR family regulator|nr:response regulator transcription factor [Clostridiales bacterium]
MDKIKVLVVEDETSIRKFIAVNLNRSNFEVLEAEDGERALSLAKSLNPQVVILDVMLPGIDGFEVCMKLRKQNPQIIIIMLTARGEDMDKIMGLELGADDYMVKPFNPLELVARIRANLRRFQKQHSNNIYFKQIILDLEAKRLYKNEQEVDLTPTEFAILKLLMKNPGKTFSRNEIMNSVWGENYFGDLKTVDVHIRRMRGKIEDDPSNPQVIKTVWGFGYRLGEED